MTVTLDAPAARGLAAHGPIWRVGCDACRDRLYLAGYTADVAAERAVREFGWRRDGDRMLCYREVRGG